MNTLKTFFQAASLTVITWSAVSAQNYTGLKNIEALMSLFSEEIKKAQL